MKLLLPLASLLCALLVASACSDKPDAAAVDEGGEHAPEGATPGSHEDWCGEHAVPESQCTRCHEELIAAFKATGDWCDDHGVPKSHCKKCDPGLVIERPPKER